MFFGSVQQCFTKQCIDQKHFTDNSIYSSYSNKVLTNVVDVGNLLIYVCRITIQVFQAKSKKNITNDSYLLKKLFNSILMKYGNVNGRIKDVVC